MARVADCEIGNSASSQGERSMTVQGSCRVAHEVEERLHNLVAIKGDGWQARIVLAANRNVALIFCLYESDNVLEQLMNVDRLLIRRSAGTEQCID